MSASAESLNSENSSSVNLVTLLDQSFQRNYKCSTAPTSNLTSPKHKNRNHSQSYRSNSTENSFQRQMDLQMNHCSDLSDKANSNNSQSIEMIVEENYSLSEMVNSLITRDTNLQESFTSEIFNSPEHIINKHHLKRCYSFNDINIKYISSLNRKHGSIQTFISTNATLSLEFESQTNRYCNNSNSEEEVIFQSKTAATESQISIPHKHETYFKKIQNFICHPIFLTGVVVTGFIFLVPTIHRLSRWFAAAIVQPPKIEAPSLLEPLSPDTLFSQYPKPIPIMESQIQQGLRIDNDKLNNVTYFISRNLRGDMIKRSSFFKH